MLRPTAALEVVAADGNTYTTHSSAIVPGLWYIDLSLDQIKRKKKGSKGQPGVRLFGRVQEGLAGQTCFVTTLDNDKEAWPT